MSKPVRRLGNLPADATSFVGRRRELTEIKRKVAEARVVSVVGPGGVGKTRFALHAAAALSRGYRDGAWLVHLAETRDPELVSNAFLSALDLRDQAATAPLRLLLAFLRDREVLLVVDSCEHLVEAVARVVTEVVKAARGVHVVTTSREPLSIPEEQVFPLTPFGQNDAVSLFTQRAAAASGSFALTDANRDDVAALCRRLDGLPLAIELAAVRTRVLSLNQIVGRLGDRFNLLTGGRRAALARHETLRTTIDWSHDLLSTRERELFRRLCVFAGRFTLEDLEAGALEDISSLVDKSLVIKEEARGVACYRLHETMRDYSALKLDESGERDSVERRFADHYLARCKESAFNARYVQLIEWLDWVELEGDNVRAVLQMCVTRSDFEKGIAIAASLGWYWMTRATTEGTRWLDLLLAPDRGEAEPRAWAYFIRGFLGVLQADAPAARDALVHAINGAREVGNDRLLVESLAMASTAETFAGDPVAASRRLEEASAEMARFHDRPARLGLLQARAINGLFSGDLDAATGAAEEGLRIARESSDLYSQQVMLINLGFTAQLTGRIDQSETLFGEAGAIARRIDDRPAQVYILGAQAFNAAVSGHARRAAQLLGSVDAMRSLAGASVNPSLDVALAHAGELATTSLGTARFQTEYDAGKRLGEQSRTDASVAPSSGLLGRREVEVASMISAGLTNKEIGARLFISQRTVDAHVRNILDKLGFDSRAQIAAWVAETPVI